MSPHRRQTRGSLSTDAQAASERSASKDVLVCRTRSGHENVMKSPTPSKAVKSPKRSPSKQQKTQQASSPRKSLFKLSTTLKVPKTLRKTPRTPQKSPPKSSVKSGNISSPKATSGNILTSKVKREPQSPSKSEGEGKNLKTKVAIKKEPQSPSKTSVPEEKSANTTPKSVGSGSKLFSLNIHESSPPQLRITRGSSAANSPISAKHNAFKSSSAKTSKVVNSLLVEGSVDGLKTQSPSSRKRASPSSSPQSAKTRRSRGKVLISMQTNNATGSEQDSLVLHDVKKYNLDKSGENKTTGLPLIAQESNPQTWSDADFPELSSRFMRRKWFSLKTRGGFTCLRSAVLTPQEIAQEVLQKTMTGTSHVTDSNFFTTKLMVRLSSKLPPVRARPSCEELVDLINSKQISKNVESITDPRVEGTAIRVKVEKRSFSDTITHVTSKPPQVISKPASPIKSNKPPKVISKLAGSPVKSVTKIQTVVNFGERNLTKKQEREIALRQLKNLRNL